VEKKLTLVSISANGMSLTLFTNVEYHNGKAVLSLDLLQEILNTLQVKRGDAYYIN